MAMSPEIIVYLTNVSDGIKAFLAVFSVCFGAAFIFCALWSIDEYDKNKRKHMLIATGIFFGITVFCIFFAILVPSNETIEEMKKARIEQCNEVKK